MWNTLHGRFLERTLGAVQAPRVAEHFEPILLPLSLVYLVWNDVRAMLIIQTLALALGALPVFWIARRTFARPGPAGRVDRAALQRRVPAVAIAAGRQTWPISTPTRSSSRRSCSPSGMGPSGGGG